ncbi:C39 family peptidase [bacterium]|nr:C39 family peptidase [bacterium]
MKKKVYAVIILGCVALTLAGFLLYPKIENYIYRMQLDRANAETMKQIGSTDVINQSITKSIEQSAVQPLIPEKAYLIVPSFCQSPFPTEESWHIHHASCEEAAVLQAVYYFNGIKTIDLDRVDSTLKDMIAWQEKHFGVHKDIHADSVKMMMMGYFGYKDDEIKIIRDATILDIKQAIAQGYPVVAPTYGRTLNNPYYKPPGPEYHMVTIIGYTNDRIITNDVGTKRGKDFSYPIDVFKKAMDREGGDIVILMPHSGIPSDSSKI